MLRRLRKKIRRQWKDMLRKNRLLKRIFRTFAEGPFFSETFLMRVFLI